MCVSTSNLGRLGPGLCNICRQQPPPLCHMCMCIKTVASRGTATNAHTHTKNTEQTHTRSQKSYERTHCRRIKLHFAQTGDGATVSSPCRIRLRTVRFYAVFAPARVSSVHRALQVYFRTLRACNFFAHCLFARVCVGGWRWAAWLGRCACVYSPEIYRLSVLRAKFFLCVCVYNGSGSETATTTRPRRTTASLGKRSMACRWTHTNAHTQCHCCWVFALVSWPPRAARAKVNSPAMSGVSENRLDAADDVGMTNKIR